MADIVGIVKREGFTRFAYNRSGTSIVVCGDKK